MDIASLVYDVSKDIYSFYQKAKERDNDIKAFRAQVLWMREKSNLVKEALQRDGVKTEDKSKVEAALDECTKATEELASTAAKLKTVDQGPQTTSAKVKAGLVNMGLKTAWPLKKETVAALAAHVSTCHGALDGAIAILHLNVGISHIERLRDLDDRIMRGKTSVDDAMKGINTSIERVLQDISRQLAEQKKTEQGQRRAEEIVQSLRYDTMDNRENQIDDQAHNADYAWLFSSEGQMSPEVTHLVLFLNESSGLFWIAGEPATGKSTLMKYLANPRREGVNIWQWEGSQDLTIACHYCWVVDAVQKTQQALLRTLIYRILKAELEIAAAVCQSIWGYDHPHGPWSVEQLWSALKAAIALSRKRICIFLDGVDELQPEKDHRDLINNLIKLSSTTKVKIVMSSRPWPIFDRLNIPATVLRMRTINRKAIVAYLQKTLGDLDLFSEFSWLCVGDIITCEHHRQWSDQKTQAFIQLLLRKADGNFLWISLMASAVRDKLESGSNLTHVERLIKDASGGLEGYIQTMIYERINDNFKSETAMALVMASDSIEQWISFWLLLASMNGELPSLEDPNHALSMPYCSFDINTLERMMKDTIKFLRTCCRDILVVTDGDRKWPAWVAFPPTVTFAHRTMHDFVHTEAIQALLYKHSPPPFSREHFKINLGIATAKVGIAGTAFPSKDYQARFFSLNLALDAIVISMERRHQSAKPFISVPAGSCIPLELAEEIEKVVLHYLLDNGATDRTAGEVLLDPACISGLGSKRRIDGVPLITDKLRILCCFLAGYGLFNLTDTILTEWPKLIMHYDELLEGVDLLSFSLGMYYLADWEIIRLWIQAPWKGVNVDFMPRLLKAGADPNAKIPTRKVHSLRNHWSTPWCVFLERLVESEKSPVIMDAGTDVSERATMQERASSAQLVKPSTSCDTKLALNIIFQHGAEIRLGKVDAVLDQYGRPYVDGRIEPLQALRKLLTSEELSKLGLDTV